MSMSVFDLEDVLNELENLSTQEKIKFLDEVYDKLEEAMGEVLSVQEEIEEQYKQEIQKRIDEAVKEFAEKNSIQQAIIVEDGVVECNYKDFGVRILPWVYSGEWEVSICLTRTNRLWQLEEIAEVVNAHYSKNSDISIPVSEDELIPKILEIIYKLIIKQS